MSLHYICENCCVEQISSEYEYEWLELREKVTDRDNQNIVDKQCKEVIPSTWVKLAETEHLVLWQEG